MWVEFSGQSVFHTDKTNFYFFPQFCCWILRWSSNQTRGSIFSRIPLDLCQISWKLSSSKTALPFGCFFIGKKYNTIQSHFLFVNWWMSYPAPHLSLWYDKVIDWCASSEWCRKVQAGTWSLRVWTTWDDRKWCDAMSCTCSSLCIHCLWYSTYTSYVHVDWQW